MILSFQKLRRIGLFKMEKLFTKRKYPKLQVNRNQTYEHNQ
jgi:hypothetical protein